MALPVHPSSHWRHLLIILRRLQRTEGVTSGWSVSCFDDNVASRVQDWWFVLISKINDTVSTGKCVHVLKIYLVQFFRCGNADVFLGNVCICLSSWVYSKPENWYRTSVFLFSMCTGLIVVMLDFCRVIVLDLNVSVVTSSVAVF